MNNSIDYPIVSVIIATYNSHKTLGLVLDALRKQSYSQDKIEILCVDGGSTDDTFEICHKYDCIILNNPKTDPVSAKMIGYQNAKGKYVIVMDHDEVLQNKDSIKIKVDALQAHPECKVAFGGGYLRPKDYPLLNQYLSEYGDPYSLFMYRFSKYYGYYEKDLSKRAKLITEDADYKIYRFGDGFGKCIIELCCLATMIDKEFFAEYTDFMSNPQTMVHLFYMMNDMGFGDVVFVQNDPLVHYSVDSIKAYLPKLKWRIVNNVHYPEKASQGFTGREKWMGKGYKKYLFPFYSVSMVIPLMDGMIMSFKRHNAIYLLHLFFCIYVTWNLVYEYMKKVFGIKTALKSYDGKKKIEIVQDDEK